MRHNVGMLTSVATIIGLAGVIASVALLAWQTRAVARQTEISNSIAGASVISSMTSSLRQVLLLFVEYPELRPYFYESKPSPLRGPKRVRILTVAEMLANILEEGLSVNRFVWTVRIYEEWPLYCADMLATSPALNEVMLQHPEWWRTLRTLQGRSAYQSKKVN
jgi:hypothetical protein